MVDFQMWNLTPITNGSSTVPLINLMEGTGSQMSYIPGLSILLSIWVVLFFVMRMRSNASHAGVAAAVSFITAIMAVMMYPLHMISGTMMAAFVVVEAIAVFVIYITEQ